MINQGTDILFLHINMVDNTMGLLFAGLPNLTKTTPVNSPGYPTPLFIPVNGYSLFTFVTEVDNFKKTYYRITGNLFVVSLIETS